MKTMRRLSDTATPEQRTAFFRGIIAALEADGVKRGDEFVIGMVPSAAENRQGPTNGTATSRKAAVMNAPRSGSQRARVLECIAEAGARGRTREELEFALHLSGNAIRPRVAELVEGRFVERAGTTRKTTMQVEAEVLVVTDLGATVHAS